LSGSSREGQGASTELTKRFGKKTDQLKEEEWKKWIFFEQGR